MKRLAPAVAVLFLLGSLSSGCAGRRSSAEKSWPSRQLTKAHLGQAVMLGGGAAFAAGLVPMTDVPATGKELDRRRVMVGVGFSVVVGGGTSGWPRTGLRSSSHPTAPPSPSASDVHTCPHPKGLMRRLFQGACQVPCRRPSRAGVRRSPQKRPGEDPRGDLVAEGGGRGRRGARTQVSHASFGEDGAEEWKLTRPSASSRPPHVKYISTSVPDGRRAPRPEVAP